MVHIVHRHCFRWEFGTPNFAKIIRIGLWHHFLVSIHFIPVQISK
jgi:hypothetical protein